MSKITGSCRRGAVTYTSAAEPVMVALCNCHHGQTQFGSAFPVNVGVPKGSLQFAAGKTTAFQDAGSSGMPVYRHFCQRCGSPIFTDVTASPVLDGLKAGTLDDTAWIRPAAGIWCESAQAWVKPPDGVATFARNPPAA